MRSSSSLLRARLFSLLLAFLKRPQNHRIAILHEDALAGDDGRRPSRAVGNLVFRDLVVLLLVRLEDHKLRVARKADEHRPGVEDRGALASRLAIGPQRLARLGIHGEEVRRLAIAANESVDLPVFDDRRVIDAGAVTVIPELLRLELVVLLLDLVRDG